MSAWPMNVRGVVAPGTKFVALGGDQNAMYAPRTGGPLLFFFFASGCRVAQPSLSGVRWRRCSMHHAHWPPRRAARRRRAARADRPHARVWENSVGSLASNLAATSTWKYAAARRAELGVARLASWASRVHTALPARRTSLLCAGGRRRPAARAL